MMLASTPVGSSSAAPHLPGRTQPAWIVGSNSRLPVRHGCEDAGGVDGYGQYCPIALAAEVFAERWTPIVLRNLGLGCERFGEILEGAPGMSRSVLSQRLRRLQQAGVIGVTGVGRQRRYRLTEPGRELVEVVLALRRWGARWLHTLPAHHDPALMLWA